MSGALEVKVALVTGGGSGIGRATALAFAREGARVTVADIGADGGKQCVELIEKAGGEALFVQTDVSQAAQVEAMVAKTVEAFGGLDIAFNNAGIGGAILPLIELEEQDWDRMMGIALKGVWLCMKYEIPRMLERGGGAIVNTSSIVGLVGLANCGDYVAAKHGVVGLTKSAALEHGEAGIRINAVCPGITETPMVARTRSMRPQGVDERAGDVAARVPGLGRTAEPEEIAEAVVWMCSDAASYMTGAAMPIDGGYAVA